MSDFLLGATVMGFWVSGLYFLRFWRQTHDRLFWMFAIAFWILGLNRCVLFLTGEAHEFHIVLSIVHLGAYLVIIVAIADKNRFWTKNRSSPESP